MKKFQTFIPNQDKNKKFVDKPLREIATISEIYSFTNENLIKRARTIDVIWFNERKMPHKFFEVEHNTDINNSLLKFFDLQDFCAGFHIVASQARKKEFDAKIAQGAFAKISDRVKFFSYDMVLRTHNKAFDVAYLQNEF